MGPGNEASGRSLRVASLSSSTVQRVMLFWNVVDIPAGITGGFEVPRATAKASQVSLSSSFLSRAQVVEAIKIAIVVYIIGYRRSEIFAPYCM